MKKIVPMLVFAALIFLGSNNIARAADYYLGAYENGQVAYLDTGSIRDSQTYRNGELESNNYSCIVKAVYQNSSEYETIDYEVIISQSVFLRKNGQPCYRWLKEIGPYYESHPVEKALVAYIERIDRQRRG